MGGGGRVGVVTVIGSGGTGGIGGGGTVTGGGGSTGGGGTGTGAVTPRGGATVEAIGSGDEASWVGAGTLLDALGALGGLGWTEPLTRAGAALRSLGWRSLAVLRSGWAWPAEARFCPTGTSDDDAFA